MNPKSIITRFPPSPTGLLQAGNVRTAIFNYLFAKKHGGKFILRIEDTDKERSKPEFEQKIIETVEWLGFPYDAFYRQSEHAPRHTEVLQNLITTGHAYVSKETPIEEGQRSQVIRFKNPNTVITFIDIIRGPITIDTTDLGDFIIGRSMTEPLYHLSVVVDDSDEGVTHVVRGEDHISNTPRQILILEAMGASIPLYAHLPLVFGPDKQKLSKRRGAKAVLEYRDEGYLPEALINYLTLLGWHPEDNEEIFTINELAERFTLERIQKASGVFDETKLRWFNHEHMKALSDDVYLSKFTNFLQSKNLDVPSYLSQILTELRNRAQTFDQARELLTIEFSFLDDGMYSFAHQDVQLLDAAKNLLLQNAKADINTIQMHLKKITELLTNIEHFTNETVKEIIFPYATEQGRASVLWPLRVALSGKEKSPDPFILAGMLGKEKTLARIAIALDVLK